MSTVEITGLGCICAAGNSLDEVMQSLYTGTRNPAPPVNIRTELDTAYPVFEVTSEMNNLSDDATRTTKLALTAVNEALEQAKLSRKQLENMSVGVCIGTTVGCTLNNEPFYRDFRSGKYPDLNPVRRYLSNNPALYMALEYSLKGPAATIANACSSGTDAIGLAKYWIENDLCDIAIAGGTDELSRITYLGFISLLISSTEPCRPFDKNRNGLNLGEGAGILIMEKTESIKKRKIDSLAAVIGYGTNADAYHPTAPHPEGTGLKNAIRQALKQASLTPDRVDFVNAHGTSTPDNDRVEGRVLAHFFSDTIPVVSTKAYTGHTLGAAGGIEAVFTVKALLDQRLPSTPGFEENDPECIISPTSENTPVNAEVGISNSLAFGGTNSTLVFRRTD